MTVIEDMWYKIHFQNKFWFIFIEFEHVGFKAALGSRNGVDSSVDEVPGTILTSLVTSVSSWPSIILHIREICHMIYPWKWIVIENKMSIFRFNPWWNLNTMLQNARIFTQWSCKLCYNKHVKTIIFVHQLWILV